MDYSVKFIGHVNPKRRPDGWPETIENQSVYRSESVLGVMEYLGAVGTKIKREEGLWSTTELPGHEKTDTVFGTGVFVPIHMFTHISFAVRSLVGEVPDVNDIGVFTQ
jgi:hypothetical protein